MDVEAIRQVLETWGLPPGGQTENMQERILGYLNDPFYCDDIICMLKREEEKEDRRGE